MSGLNLAATSKEDQDKVAIDLVASGVAYKERLLCRWSLNWWSENSLNI